MYITSRVKPEISCIQPGSVHLSEYVSIVEDVHLSKDGYS